MGTVVFGKCHFVEEVAHPCPVRKVVEIALADREAMIVTMRYSHHQPSKSAFLIFIFIFILISISISI